MADHRFRQPPRTVKPVAAHRIVGRGLRAGAMFLGCAHLFLGGAWFQAGNPVLGVGSIILGLGIPGALMLAEL